MGECAEVCRESDDDRNALKLGLTTESAVDAQHPIFFAGKFGFALRVCVSARVRGRVFAKRPYRVGDQRR